MRLAKVSALLLPCSAMAYGQTPTDKLLREARQSPMLQTDLRVLTDGGRANK
jgi:hypothetical protein